MGGAAETSNMKGASGVARGGEGEGWEEGECWGGVGASDQMRADIGGRSMVEDKPGGKEVLGRL